MKIATMNPSIWSQKRTNSGSGNFLIHNNKISKLDKQIQRVLLVLVILSFIVLKNTYSQNYDLLVTAQNDSIACHLDSISANKIFFKMRYNKKWIHTYYDKNQILDYQPLKINKKNTSFKRGTSYLINPDSLLINQLRRNIVFGTAGYLLYNYTLNMNYERILNINETNRRIWSFRIGCGIINGNGKIVLGTFNNLVGRGKNKFEMDVGATYIDEPHSYGPHFISFVLNAGYRRQSPDKKFIFRVGAGTPEGLYLSYGYSF